MVCVKAHTTFCLFIDLPVKIDVGKESLKCEVVTFAFLCRDKNTDQNQPGRGKALLYLVGYSPSQREARAGTRGRAEIEQKHNHRGVLLTGLLSHLLTLLLCITHGHHLQRAEPFHIKMRPPQTYLGSGPLFPITLACVELIAQADTLFSLFFLFFSFLLPLSFSAFIFFSSFLCLY